MPVREETSSQEDSHGRVDIFQSWLEWSLKRCKVTELLVLLASSLSKSLSTLPLLGCRSCKCLVGRHGALRRYSHMWLEAFFSIFCLYEVQSIQAWIKRKTLKKKKKFKQFCNITNIQGQLSASIGKCAVGRRYCLLVVSAVKWASTRNPSKSVSQVIFLILYFLPVQSCSDTHTSDLGAPNPSICLQRAVSRGRSRTASGWRLYILHVRF